MTDALGLEQGTVRLLSYRDEWPDLFAAERRRIEGALNGIECTVEHVGSTAVPGLAAKPIIDIMIGLARYEEHVAAVDPLQRLGYRYRGEFGLPGRQYFVLGEPRTHHIHMVARESELLRDHIRFRDQLRAHPEVARAYENLKRELASRYPRDRHAYTEGKAAFIRGVIAQSSRRYVR